MMKETNIHSQVTSTIAGDDGEAMAKSEGYVAENGFVATEPMHWYEACVRVNYEKKSSFLLNKASRIKNRLGDLASFGKTCHDQ